MNLLKEKKIMLFWLLLIAAIPVLAEYQINRYSINNSAGLAEQASLQSSRFEIKGNAGQIDASDHLTGAGFKLNGGFWHENTDLIFKDNLE